MEPDPSALLERSVSRLSTASAQSIRGHGVQARSRSRVKLKSQPSSSASSIAASDKSLTSFPSFSPESPRYGRSPTRETNVLATPNDRKASNAQTASSIVHSLTSTDTQKAEQRNALFEDTPLATRNIPGTLHLADDNHIGRLIARHGAIELIRQVAEDIAQRDVQIVNLRRRSDERERALRKIILECGLSNLDLETRLRAVETELRAQDQLKRGGDGGVSDMMNDAMHDSVSYGGFASGDINDSTIRVSTLSVPKENEAQGTMKGWKDWILGAGSSKRNSRTSSINGDVAKTGVRSPASGDRRAPLQEDLFTPPDTESVRSSSRASSIYSGQAGQASRKPSSLASMALQLVAGRANGRDDDSIRGRSNSTGQGGGGSLRASSTASVKTSASTRAVSTQVGPKALMAMRRATPAPLAVAGRTQPRERWGDTVGTSPTETTAKRPDNYGPVEMDTIFSPEGQPPTLTHIYNNFLGSDLTDRFGFIYDQRRKKRQREAAQVARQVKRGSRTEMLTGGRPGMSPNLLEDNASSIQEISSDDRSDTPTSAEDLLDQSKHKRWQDYLKIATFPTELLSHTPSITASGLQVLEGGEVPKSPGLITSEERGFLPSASTTAAVNSEAAAQPEEDVPAATLVKEDVEPVRLLLKQLSDVHDALQRDKSTRWNEFLRKVRAERKREGEAAAAAAVAAAEARFQQAPLMIPEAKLADGEIIGIADLGVKGKVGRAKWNEFRNLVLGGIPVTQRPKIWSECSGTIFMRIPGYYDDLVSQSAEGDDPQVVQQIELDITRTLTDNIFFRKGPGVAKLNEVLRAYARRNPKVGYCQGMNLITANLLLIMPSTEDVFWILVSMIEHILPDGYYDHSLMASRADQQVLRQYVTHVLPRLSQHLDELCIELETLTFQWFLSVFTDCLSAEALFRVWDVVLCTNDGSTFLFQVALALLKLNEQQILQCTTPAAAYTYISHQMTNHAISIDGLIKASEGLRKVVKREDVEDRRTKAIEAEKQLMKEREEHNQLRRMQKALTVPAVVTTESASAVPSPLHSPVPKMSDSETASIISLNAGDSEEDTRNATVKAPTSLEEEA
ncbi:rab-GTPase-TBC domain-containing protein [Pseudomassariella vexata]|uniref:Rab-GTPase-TBC domain-domain-containing protein n=1 Tax=Pseudomassariella vexata TaxID=1141098 RepID=A0A1Y2DA62_9PEZI|nr:rab-GTPase-TBC domain-containing protein [Pseudomassariella vexata]ORY56153.1 rab-GTPase-TBC domain-domain-containing protein [Pseudomassariella vexata]